jgi:hypothetical protein
LLSFFLILALFNPPGDQLNADPCGSGSETLVLTVMVVGAGSSPTKKHPKLWIITWIFQVLTVMVVGAGRGPLVRAALTAAKTAERKIRVFAVEKNPNAVVTLQQQKIEVWGDQVPVSL